MNPKDEEIIARWVDGELDPAEQVALEARLTAEPELQEFAESLQGLGDLMRENAGGELEPPYPDFFNSQVAKRIAEERNAEVREGAGSKGIRKEGAGIFDFLKAPWLIPAAGAALLLLAAITRFGTPTAGDDASSSDHTVVAGTYTPVEGVAAETYYSKEADATVIVLEGLADIPAERTITAHHATSYEADLAGGANYLYGEDGELLLVMVGGHGQRPGFFVR